MEDTQMLKGILEGCVLAVIDRGETYGYEILATLDGYGFHDLIEGTLYPVLTRLDKKDYITCRVGESPRGPKRKYYKITDRGREYLASFIREYQEMKSRADQILFYEKDEAEDRDGEL